VSGGVAEVFRNSSKRYLAEEEKRLAAFLTSLPTDEDRSRFAEAARLFLSSDPVIRKLPAGRRRAQLRAPTAQLLLEAADRVFSEDHQGGGSELDRTRLRIAQLIVGGIHATTRRVLVETALLLRETSDQARDVRSKIEGKRGRAEAISGDARNKRRVAFLKPAAEHFRKTTRLRTEKDRARRLFDQSKKQLERADRWSTVEALIEFARRNRIKI
jgi:hypothetical protein